MSVSEASRTGLSGDRGADASATGAPHLFNIQRLRHFLSVLVGLAAFGKRASLRGIMTHIRVRRAGERGAKPEGPFAVGDGGEEGARNVALGCNKRE